MRRSPWDSSFVDGAESALRIVRAALFSLALLLLFAGCDSSFSISRYPEFASGAAQQGRPGGPWSSGACSLDDRADCFALCAKHVMDACNDVGVSIELSDWVGSAMSAWGEYGMACTFGSRGACYNQSRLSAGRSVGQMAEDQARKAAAHAAELAKWRAASAEPAEKIEFAYLHGSSERVVQVSRRDVDTGRTSKLQSSYERDAMIEQASRELDCATEWTVVDEPLGERGESPWWSVTGCEHHALYLKARRAQVMRSGNNGTTRTVRWHVRFFSVSAPSLASRIHALFAAGADETGSDEASDPAAYSLDVGLLHTYGAATLDISAEDVVRNAETVDATFDLMARDLSCRRDRVKPFFVLAGSRVKPQLVAEGCGKRAVYLPADEAPYRVASVVEVR